MQRLNKTAQAGLGLTFFLFLGFAIIPFSLRAAGVQVSPRLSAAIDVWRQIVDVLGTGYQSGGESASEPAATPSDIACPHQQFMCANQTDETLTSEYPVERPSEARALNARVESRSQAVYRIRRPHQATAPHASRIIAAEAVQASFELEPLNDLKLEKLPRERIFWKSFKQSELVRFLVPENLKMQVRISTTSPSVSKPAACKVRSGIEKPREATAPSANPDNCDL